MLASRIKEYHYSFILFASMKILILYFVIQGLSTSIEENPFGKGLERKSIKASQVYQVLLTLKKAYISSKLSGLQLL